MNDLNDGTVTLKRFPPPTGILGPYARRTPYHVFRVLSASGAALVAGTCGQDHEAAMTYVLKVAREKGIFNPKIVSTEEVTK
jgi:hypothetical protein